VKGANFTAFLGDLRRSAELEQSLAPGFFASHARGQVLRDERFQMEPQFFIELTVASVHRPSHA
jgi:hypothetical protein